MADVVQGIGCGENRDGFHIRHGLHTQAAGDDHHVLGALGECQLLFGLDLVAEEIHPGGAGDVLALLLRKANEAVKLRLGGGVEFLEALVAGHDKEIVLPRKQALQLFLAL